MSDQPEALRLADRLDLWGDQGDLLEAAAELRRLQQRVECLQEAIRVWERLSANGRRYKAERDALKAAAEKGTEYVLAQINQDLRAERDALLADAERYRWLRDTLHGAKAGGGLTVNDELQVYEAPIPGEEVRIYWYPDTPAGHYEQLASTLDAAIDAAREVKP